MQRYAIRGDFSEYGLITNETRAKLCI
uniref:Uncharacterized protein n=1 Tax=Arundo donax TaxID=35708 RepID=A0A0A9GUI3_ARUDO